MSRRWPSTSLFFLALLAAPTAGAQGTQTPSPPAAQPAPATREEEIALARRQKHARLWPERENPLVVRANGLMDRGFVEGIQSGEGNNGWQLLLTGTRPNQGQTFGIGYRRSDLMGDALSSRWSVRGTLGGAFLVDGEAQLNRFRQSEDTFAELYAKFERSPRMEFYGLGADTSKADRTGYLLDTGQVDVRAGYRFSRQFNAGVDAGYGHTHTAAVAREDIPSIETTFDATTAPGLFDATSFAMLGGFAGFDTRDLPRGPKHGTFLGVSVNRFKDIDGGRYSHTQVELNGQQFLPYFNATKVVALLVRARFAFTGGDDQVVPFYLQPKLGGNFELRGFAPYRFHDNNSFVASAEHRWYAFSGLEMALFVDAGTTVPSKGSIAIDNLSYSGGFGLRGRLGGAVVVRTDVARSREGWRWIWSMSDVSRRQY